MVVLQPVRDPKKKGLVYKNLNQLLRAKFHEYVMLCDLFSRTMATLGSNHNKVMSSDFQTI